MAECPDEPEETPGYKPPAEKSLDAILNQDTEDESLQRYKQSLLGNVGNVKVDPNETRRVILKSLVVLVEGRPDITLDLTQDLKKLKDSPITMKEGTEYKLKVIFTCPREIVAGLRFLTTVHRKGLKVASMKYMVGSYGPAVADHEYVNKESEIAPSGMIARGKYTCKSEFIDDDKNCFLKWEWVLDIKKDWDK